MGQLDRKDAEQELGAQAVAQPDGGPTFDTAHHQPRRVGAGKLAVAVAKPQSQAGQRRDGIAAAVRQWIGQRKACYWGQPQRSATAQVKDAKRLRPADRGSYFDGKQHASAVFGLQLKARSQAQLGDGEGVAV